MSAMTSKLAAIIGLVSLAPAVMPALATAGGSATVYELTESMKINQKKDKGAVITSRAAFSVLSGVASVGSPLCPSASVASGPDGCTVIVYGSDDVDVSNGLGTLSGSFETQVQGDNPVDGPESTVLTGSFSGIMDFSPAILHQIPYGTVVGTVVVGNTSTPFTGVFRLPFAGNAQVEVAPGYTMTLRQIFCPGSPTPNPYASMYGGYDLAYLDFDASGVQNGLCLDVQPIEVLRGTPMVRFDVKF